MTKQEYKHQWYLKHRVSQLAKQKKDRKLFPWKATLKWIKTRCNNENDDLYLKYGAKGIKCLITDKELKELWFRDKAYKMKKPSIDRINNKGNYEYNNCQYIEFKINSIKDRCKPIRQFDLKGNFIREWKSGANASKVLGLNKSKICLVAQGKRNHTGGFKWQYKF